MKTISLAGLFCLILFSCTSSSVDPAENISSCEQERYYLIWNINTSDTQWKIRYLEYLGNCLEDTSLAKKLAMLDAENGNYNILLHGIEVPLCPFQHVHDEYPISFHVPARVQSEVGEFYNDQVKIYIRKDLGIDLDSVLRVKFIECYAVQEDSLQE